MAPLDRRRRRPILPTVLLALLVAIVLALLVGGILDAGRASAPYRREVNRSYVAQGSELALRSNSTGAQLRALMASMTAVGRDRLSHELGILVATSAEVAQEAAALAPPDPTVDGFAEVMAARARALSEIQGAVDGLLGLTRGGGATLGTSAAADRITAAGALLGQADRSYAQVRRQFLVAPGNARLPRSRWVGTPSGWAATPVLDLAQALTLTPSLAPRHRVVLVAGTVHIVPEAVPPVHPGGPSVVLPTGSLQVGAVVANEGDVAEKGIRASASVTPQGPGRADLTSLGVSIGPGGSVAVTFPSLVVEPGDTYTLTVSIDPPPGQADRTGTSASYVVRIAPPTPPTTTTTTTTTPTARSH
jgi:hypothetical protein